MIRRVGIVALCLAAAAPSQAQGPREQASVTLEQAIALVRDHSPSARALRSQVGVAEAQVDLAGVYPNPQLSYVGMGRFDGSNTAINGTQHQVWMDVPLLIADQHHARRGVARAEADAAHDQLELSLLELEVETRRAFASLLSTQEQVARMEASRAELGRVQTTLESRARAGAQSRYHTVRLAIEMARLDANISVARTRERIASAALAALAGRPGWYPHAEGALETRAPAAVTVDDLPVVRAARARALAAERDIDRAERERIPEMRLGAGAYLTTDPDSSSAYLGLSLPLPIFDTGEAAVRRARAAHDAAVRSQEAIEQRARARLASAVSILDARREAIARFDTESAAQLSELVEMAESAYRLGASNIFELLDAFRARTDLELTRIELLTAASEAEIDVLEVSGHL